MSGRPIPQRIPPLSWRQPAFLWTPLGLALAIGWPVALFYDDPAPQRVAIAALFVVFALALLSLGASWMLGHAPRSRRVAVLHVVAAGALAALIAPFALTWLLALVADYAHDGAAEQFSLAMSAATTPLVLMLGLPVVLVSGLIFTWTALKPGRPADEADDHRHYVQPFR